MPFGPAVFEVFVADGLVEIDAVDVGQGAEPGENVGELAGGVVVAAGGAAFAFAFVQRGGELADFFDQPHEGAGGAAGVVGFEVAGVDVLLEGFEGEVGGGAGHGFSLRALEVGFRFVNEHEGAKARRYEEDKERRTIQFKSRRPSPP